MNQIEKEFFSLLDMTHKVRDGALALVDPHDMSFALPGNGPLGDLLNEFGNVEAAYTKSFRTFKQDFATKADEWRAWVG